MDFHFKYLIHNNAHTCHSERSEESLVSNPNALRKVNVFFVKRFFGRSSLRMTYCWFYAKKFSESVSFSKLSLISANANHG